MPRVKTPAAQVNLFEAKTSTAPCVPAIRKAVAEWKAGGCKGVTETTRLLLKHWFVPGGHRLPDRRMFAYHQSQQEAIETLVYLFEVANVRRQQPLLVEYAPGGMNPHLLQHDDFARYCLKMATGSGKTKVMSLAIAWQYFNAVREPEAIARDYARTFLLLAPNVIVYERLSVDLANGRIFKADPVIPPEFQLEWDFDCYMRGESERANAEGALYLTNIQQLHERNTSGTSDEPDAMTAMLGSKPPAQKISVDNFDARILARTGNCLVINDEAHHTHDEKLKWNEIIRDLNTGLCPGEVMHLDMTAPLQQGGAVHLDGLRLPAEASHFRQHCEAARERNDDGHTGATVRHCRCEIPRVSDGGRGALARVPRPTCAPE